MNYEFKAKSAFAVLMLILCIVSMYVVYSGKLGAILLAFVCAPVFFALLCDLITEYIQNYYKVKKW
jgi:hypothetical protein